MYKKIAFLLLTALAACPVFSFAFYNGPVPDIYWSIVLQQPGRQPVTVTSFTQNAHWPLQVSKNCNGIVVQVQVTKKDDLLWLAATASSKKSDSCYISLVANYTNGTLFTYLGEEKKEEIYRQSPHNPLSGNFGKLAKQDVPMIAIKDANGFTIAVNDAPVFYDNFTTQWVDPKKKTARLSSGDNGLTIGPKPENIIIESYYHHISPGAPHRFNGIIFTSRAADVNNLRKDALLAIAKRWGKNINDRFGATSFASNYMLLRKNETGNSTYWVVPGILYSNKQYSRDAFWQSMVLPAQFDAECYKNEAVAQTRGAERQLFALIWAGRTRLNGGEPDMAAAQKSLDYIEAHTRDGKFYSNDDLKKKDFQSWFDAVAFDTDEVITYNQGLLAVALLSAEKLGLHPKTSAEKAIAQYQAMFNSNKGYFPCSEKKDLPAVDALVGDVLAQVFFKRTLLTTESVQKHFTTITTVAKTPYGYKVVCLPDGSFPPPAAFHATSYPVDPSLGQGPGNYQYSGSWFLYDMLFLIDSYLHKVPGAMDEMLWRGTLDFKLGGTYFEYINTASGKPYKANQGWNAAVYAIWKKLMEQGLADEKWLDAIDQVQ